MDLINFVKFDSKYKASIPWNCTPEVKNKSMIDQVDFVFSYLYVH